MVCQGWCAKQSGTGWDVGYRLGYGYGVHVRDAC